MDSRAEAFNLRKVGLENQKNPESNEKIQSLTPHANHEFYAGYPEYLSLPVSGYTPPSLSLFGTLLNIPKPTHRSSRLWDIPQRSKDREKLKYWALQMVTRPNNIIQDI
jgi:hypothetical protein